MRKFIRGKFDTERKRQQWAWAMYDWANAAFSAVASAVFAGPYITSLTKEEACEKYTNGACFWCPLEGSCLNYRDFNGTCAEDRCNQQSEWCCDVPGFVPVGITKTGYGSFYAFTLSAAVICQILILPFLGAMSDYSTNTKKHLFITTVVGSTFTALLFAVHDPSLWWMGGLFFFFANISFGSGNVFYDSFLNIISTPDERTSVSSMGYATGYFGGGILLAISVVLFALYPGNLTIRCVFLACGAWWFTFSLILFRYVPERQKQEDVQIEEETGLIETSKIKRSTRGHCILAMRRMKESLKVLWNLPQSLIFLVAAALYNDGIQTVIAMASTFGQEALNLTSLQLAIIILLVQFVAVIGAFFFGWLAQKIGDKAAISISLTVWVCCISSMYFIDSFWGFFTIANIVGMVLGGSQALSRAFFAKMIPKGYESQLFSFYQLSQRGTSWMGALMYGLVTTHFDNNPRPALLFLNGFIGVGLLLLLCVNVEKAKIQVQKYNREVVQSDLDGAGAITPKNEEQDTEQNQ
eukprot:TRINITY_DN5500_c0_g1_i1.p1 TRINITY_DN5500_c0_g1~~TRINITY_DN5500_c0_g1_i1.p1  ORF type:complete len:524 (-),score=73.12 TRINITY_DN5500_c0_g1_i1:43-1614(-)